MPETNGTDIGEKNKLKKERRPPYKALAKARGYNDQGAKEPITDEELLTEALADKEWMAKTLQE
jgi:hypothetical protein